MNPGAFSVRNRALVNAVFVLVVAVGIYSLLSIPRELNPRVGFNWAFIDTIWVGANPEEVEQLISIPIEDEIQTVEDIDVITSQSRQSGSFVWVKFEQIPEREFERRVDDVRARLTNVDLPAGAEDTTVEEFSSYDFQPVASVVVHGTAGERVLHEIAKQLREDLRDIEGVSKVDRFGDRDPVIHVSCDPRKLEAHRLDPADVELALRLASLNLPAGIFKMGGQEYLLRTRSEVADVDDVANVALRAGGAGTRVLVRDVAEVRRGFEERTLISRFDAEPSITLPITKTTDGNTLDIVARAREIMTEWKDRLPAGVHLAISNDESKLVGIILGVLQSNALLGLLMVVVALFLFLGWRSALCAALGIPVTFLLAVVALDWTGSTLNGNTLFGLILVLGMVVDDAIVILENSYRHLQSGKRLETAVIDGVREVVSPVVVSSFTTMAGFLPLVLLTGTIGKFMRIIPITVSLVLLASLIEALLILPSHFVDIVRLKETHAGGQSRFDRWADRYEHSLNAVLRWRYAVVPGAVIALVASVGLIPLIGVDLFAGDEMSSVQIGITMPDGTRLDATDSVVQQFEAAASRLPEGELEGVIGNTGLYQEMDEWHHGPHVGQVWVDVVEARDRERTIDEIIADLRKRTDAIPGPVEVEFNKVEQGPPADAPIELMVKGPELDELGEVSDRIQTALRSMAGVENVRDDLNLRQPSMDVVVDREAAVRHGLDPTRIAASVHAAFAGATATTFRSGNEEVDVVVRLQESARSSRNDIARFRFVNPAGEIVPFEAVARLETRYGPMNIRRHDRERAVTVSADIDEDVTDLATVNRELDAEVARILPLYPAVRTEPGGQFSEFWETFEDLTKLFALGLLLNFMLMAGQFKNWTQPLIIMAVVPLSFIGAMVGLMVSGNPFSIATLYGFVALAGVAVNDSIVLVSFINQQRAAGIDARTSIINAGRLRLRPILLTSVTTILGLLPMAIGLGGSSKTWQPLASTIAAGLAVATVICLLIIPCLQAIRDDADRLFRRSVA